MKYLLPVLGGLVAFAIVSYMQQAHAGGKHHTTNNYYTEVNEITEITEMSVINSAIGDELAKGIVTVLSNDHQFDFATYDYQGSVAGAWYDGENAVSFGLAKRFRKMDVLWHGSYTENGSKTAVVVGGTFRF